MGLKLSGVAKLQAQLKAKERAMQREAAGALGEAASELERGIKSRVFPARRVNQQDAPGQRPISLTGRSPLRTRVQPAQKIATVRVSRHWTGARARAVRNTFVSLGLIDKLVRRGLVVKNRGFILFSRDPKLAYWARRPDKGSQALRHVVRLSDPRTIQRLTLNPGVRQATPRIAAIWLQSTRRALKS